MDANLNEYEQINNKCEEAIVSVLCGELLRTYIIIYSKFQTFLSIYKILKW